MYKDVYKWPDMDAAEVDAIEIQMYRDGMYFLTKNDGDFGLRTSWRAPMLFGRASISKIIQLRNSTIQTLYQILPPSLGKRQHIRRDSARYFARNRQSQVWTPRSSSKYVVIRHMYSASTMDGAR